MSHEDQKKTIVMKDGDRLLVRVETKLQLGSKEYLSVSFEMWNDFNKYEQNTRSEEKNGQQYIYCMNYATTDQESAIFFFYSQQDV